jgi:hypothetical protein
MKYVAYSIVSVVFLSAFICGSCAATRKPAQAEQPDISKCQVEMAYAKEEMKKLIPSVTQGLLELGLVYKHSYIEPLQCDELKTITVAVYKHHIVAIDPNATDIHNGCIHDEVVWGCADVGNGEYGFAIRKNTHTAYPEGCM